MDVSRVRWTGDLARLAFFREHGFDGKWSDRRYPPATRELLPGPGPLTRLRCRGWPLDRVDVIEAASSGELLCVL